MTSNDAMQAFMAAFEAMKEKDVFTEEGYRDCISALQFMDEAQREGFLAQFVLVCTQM